VRWWRAAALVVAVGLIAGCDVGSIRRSGAPEAPRPAASASARSAIAEVRRAVVPVPKSFTLQTLTFADSTRGYALYARCGEDAKAKPICEASLIATVDGGRTWSVRRHPRPTATSQQMVVNANGAVVLLAEPYGWFLSRDGGRTFRHTGPPGSPPQDYLAEPGRFQIWESQTEPDRVVEYVNGRRRDLPSQPPIPNGPQSVKYDESGRLWAAGLTDGGGLVVAFSPDHGQTWRRQEVPGQAGRFTWVWLEMSADAGDVWLLAQHGEEGFPQLWRFDGAGWVRRPVSGPPQRVQSVAPLGSGALAVTLLDGAGVVDYRYRPTDWPLAGAHLQVLSDGTLMADRALPGEVLLGLGHGTSRLWVQVIVEQG
jgi:hypothetical protein